MHHYIQCICKRKIYIFLSKIYHVRYATLYLTQNVLKTICVYHKRKLQIDFISFLNIYRHICSFFRKKKNLCIYVLYVSGERFHNEHRSQCHLYRRKQHKTSYQCDGWSSIVQVSISRDTHTLRPTRSVRLGTFNQWIRFPGRGK